MGGIDITNGSYDDNGIEDGARIEIQVPAISLTGTWRCRNENLSGEVNDAGWVTESELDLQADGSFTSKTVEVSLPSHMFMWTPTLFVALCSVHGRVF